MNLTTDRLATIESAALAGCPTLPATVVELARELRETRRQRDSLFTVRERLSSLVDEAIAAALQEKTRHG